MTIPPLTIKPWLPPKLYYNINQTDAIINQRLQLV